MTVILISHNMEDVVSVTSRVVDFEKRGQGGGASEPPISPPTAWPHLVMTGGA